MKTLDRTRNCLIKHCERYPDLQISDILKFIFQSSFGCEHLVSTEKRAVDYIRKEYSSFECTACDPIDRLDGGYSRVSLSVLNDGIAPETLGRLFCNSAKIEEGGRAALLEKLEIVRELICVGQLPFDIREFDEAVLKWREIGYPAVHHSPAFRDKYRPAYRVIDNKYVDFLPLFSHIDRLLAKGAAVVALEGGSASGKTTLSKILEEIYDCNVFHMDDFFLRPEQRTPERFAEVGGNLDRERFLEEVLVPLSENKNVCYRRFNCSTQELEEPITAEKKRLTVIEGVYSMHPELEGFYDLSVFLDIDEKTQRERIVKRNLPQMAKRFFEEWIPLENEYYSKMNVKERCNLTLQVNNNLE